MHGMIMKTGVGVLLLCVFISQDAVVYDLIEQLRSDDIAAREEAFRRLRAMGRSIKPELEEASKDADVEVAGRANQILLALSVEEMLTPALRKAMPGLADRLAVGGDHSWTEAFLEARVFPEDWDILAPSALRGARDGFERARVLARIMERGYRSAIPEVRVLLRSSDARDRRLAVEALGRLGDREVAADVAAYSRLFRKSADCLMTRIPAS